MPSIDLFVHIRRATRRSWRIGRFLTLCVLLTACTIPAEEHATTRGPAEADPALIDPATAMRPATGRYRIDTERSDLRILVYRAGRLAHLGHNHVVEARDIRGEVLIAQTPQGSRVNVTLPVQGLVVDDPAARTRSGPDFADPIDPEGIAGTRKNMLGPDQLAPERWPTIRIVGTVRNPTLSWPATDLTLEVAIRIRDTTRRMRIPIVMTALPDGALRASGRFALHQTAFGMTPVTAMAGALAVRDRIDLVFSLVATPEV